MNFKLNKKLGTSLIVLLVMTCFIPAIAGASSLGHGRQDKGVDRKGYHRPVLGIWQDQQMVQKLGLTEEQVKQVRDQDFTFREKRLVLKAQLDGYRLQMDKAFSGDDIDDTAVLSLAQKISDVKGKLFIQKIESRLALGKILNADQITKLKSSDMHQKKRGSRYGEKYMTRHHTIEMPGDKKPFEN